MRVNSEIGSRVFRHNVTAADITEEKDVLTIDNEEIPFSDAVNDVLKVHFCEDVTLSSLSETVVVARHDGEVEEVSTHMMEPCVDSHPRKRASSWKNTDTLKRDTVIAESRPVCAVIGTVTAPASSSRNKYP
ncbi:hypothetical protein HHI36_001238 [Cryptolaemus montrouzieri]|uniref:Uncharacterized protein n=1 Tax=Cryptolaemus montrouzieri TaxID=559131 RepID=A0ABD2P8E3_9CUCU